jgi:hypothetical protein
MFALEQTERRRRAAISLFVAATFGMAAILSLPVVRLIPFPFRLPSAAEVLGPPTLPEIPPREEGPPALRPGSLGGGREHPVETTVTGGLRPSGSDRRSDDREDDGGGEISVTSEPTSTAIHKDKVPIPPSSHEHVSKDKDPAPEKSELHKADSSDG